MVLILAGCSSKNAENVATQKESVTEIPASTEKPTEAYCGKKEETEQLTETEPPKQEEKNNCSR